MSTTRERTTLPRDPGPDSARDRKKESPLPRLGIVLVAGLLLAAPSIRAQESSRVIYEDEEARRLVEGVVESRAAAGSEARRVALDTRSHVGFLIPNQWNWRHRTLYRKEVAAYLVVEDQEATEARVIARDRGAPLIGDHMLEEDARWGRFGFDPEAEEPALLGMVGLGLSAITPDIPSSDLIPGAYFFLDSTFVDPVGKLGPTVYRYRTVPEFAVETEDGVALLAVQFEPREGSDQNFAGLVWFDPVTGQPVRAMLRPSGEWEVRGGLRGFVGKIPLLQKNAIGSLEFVSWDYRRDPEGVAVPTEARVAGSLSMFWGQAIFPVDLDWAFDWSNADPSADRTPPPALEGGWSLNPDHDFLRGELFPFLRELDRAGGTLPPPGWKPTLTKAVSSVRFNQVQGVNFAVTYPLPVTPATVLEGRLDIPTSGFEPTGALTLRHTLRPWNLGVGGYARLRDANWMEPVNGVTNSITALLTGYDDGNYYLAQGGALTAAVERRPFDLLVEAFGEYQKDAPLKATYSLFKPDPDQEQPPAIEADPGAYFGLRSRLDLQLGDDAQRGVAVLRFFGAAVGGASAYSSLGTTTDLIGPLPGPFTGAARITFNVATGNVPSQALFYLGGTKTVRGYPANIASGPSSFIATGEIGTNLPLIRLIAFADVGYAGTSADLFRQKGLGAVGGGVSIGDGAVRVDVARGLVEGGVWRIHILSSALF
jgi:hypothetical protein